MSNILINKMGNINEQVLDGKPCTIQGTTTKTMLLLLVTFAAAAVVYNLCANQQYVQAALVSVVGAILSVILIVSMSFSPKSSAITAPIFAFAEGATVGSITFQLETMYPGIVLQAVSITFATLFVFLILYSSRIIIVTNRVRSTIITATFSIFIVYLLQFILMFFHITLPIFGSNTIGIVFSLVVCTIAASNFLLDFDNIERACNNFVPQYYEWYGAAGVLVTLVWVYVEILKLLAKLKERGR